MISSNSRRLASTLAVNFEHEFQHENKIAASDVEKRLDNL